MLRSSNPWENESSWNQFKPEFNGDFDVSGVPVLLGEAPEKPVKSDLALTGTCVWDASVALAKVLERNQFLVEGRNVLEIGAGRGLCGICAALLGAASVVITDLPYVLEPIREELALNGLQRAPDDGSLEAQNEPVVVVAELDWRRPEDFLRSTEGQKPFDLLLASDVIWMPELVEPLVTALRAILEQNPKAELVLVHTTRLLSVEEAFFERMAAQGFRIEWKLAGEDGLPIWSVMHPSAFGFDQGPPVRWHREYTPNTLVTLMCFKWDAQGVS